MKRIALLGSTGSIGTQTLDVVSKNPDKISVFALATNSNIELLKKQISQFKPEVVGVGDEKKARALASTLKIPVLSGATMLEEIAAMDDYDTLVAATVGLTGIRATLTAIEKKKDIALANKETLVAAGSIVMHTLQENSVRMIPIDSEHSALFQCLNGEDPKNIHKIHITCSGGALRDFTKENLNNVSIDDALGHKTWKMGDKITIDSATLMNKGFEVIEAAWLYGVPAEKINVVIHPQSIIHSMVEYTDGSIMAQMCNPDMTLPIQYALSYPERWDAPLTRFDFSTDLTFAAPDLERFPCLGYALDALDVGGTMPAVMNAANDCTVAAFLNGKCAYMDIPKTIRMVMDAHTSVKNPTLEDIESTIAWATEKAQEILS